MIAWPPDLIEDIARRKCVLVLGSGISKNSQNDKGERPKDWKEFLSSSCLRCKNKAVIKNLIKYGDFLTACELIKMDLGRDDFNSLIKAEFLTPQFIPAKAHEHIFNLDSRLIVTPNFDKIYDTYANNVSQGTVLVKKFNDSDLADCIRRPESVIIKIHGSVDSPDDLIFTRKDYSKARSEYRNFYTIIDALSLTHTFIFLGCGTNDPDIRLILEDYSFKFTRNKRHYIVLPKGALHEKVMNVIGETMSLKPILYDPKNYHAQLTDSIGILVNLVEQKRVELAGNMKW